MRFEICWCGNPNHVMSFDEARDASCAALAVWPAPLLADESFKAAGFEDFVGDVDADWELALDAVIERVLLALKEYGEPELMTPSLVRKAGFFRRYRDVDYLSNITWPMFDDRVPDTIMTFGEHSSLRTGQGQPVFWITLPRDVSRDDFLFRVAASHPLRHDQIDLKALAMEH